MKKVSVNQYAEVLYQGTKDLSGHELNQALKNFVSLLVSHNNLKLADKIMDKFSELYNRHEGLEDVEITSHKKLSDEAYHYLTAWLKHQLKKEIQLTKKTDENLKGGIVIKYGDTVIDDSLATKLNNLKKYLVN